MMNVKFLYTRGMLLYMCERHNIVVVGSCVYACVCRSVMILFNQGLNYYLLNVHLDKFRKSAWMVPVVLLVTDVYNKLKLYNLQLSSREFSTSGQAKYFYTIQHLPY